MLLHNIIYKLLQQKLNIEATLGTGRSQEKILIQKFYFHNFDYILSPLESVELHGSVDIHNICSHHGEAGDGR